MEQNLIAFMYYVAICDQITKNWNHLRTDIQTMNDDITAIQQPHMALQGLLENLVEQTEELAAKKAQIKGTTTSAMPGIGG